MKTGSMTLKLWVRLKINVMPILLIANVSSCSNPHSSLRSADTPAPKQTPQDANSEIAEGHASELIQCLHYLRGCVSAELVPFKSHS